MTVEVARFLLGLLDRQTLSVGAPDFEETAQLVIRARRELLKWADDD